MSTGVELVVKSKLPIRLTLRQATGARGRKGGRPPKLSTKEIKTIRALLKTADIPVA